MDQESLPVCSTPKCSCKTSSAHDVPLNHSQHFQRIFLGMLEVSGWTQGLEISSSAPGPAPLNHSQVQDFHHPTAPSAPPSVSKGTNPNFSLKIIEHSKFSQEFSSLDNLWGPSLPQAVTPMQRWCLHPLWEWDFWRMEIFGAPSSHPKENWETRSLQFSVPRGICFSQE